MTAVDHAELGSDLGYWEMEAGRLHEGRKLASEFSEVEWGFLKRALTQSLALLSEIEGLKAERDGLTVGWVSEWTGHTGKLCRCFHEAEADARESARWMDGRHYAVAADLRTQAPDSWRPDLVDVKSLMIEAYYSGWEDGSCGDEYDAWTAAAESERLIDERAPALRPQTAESGDA